MKHFYNICFRISGSLVAKIKYTTTPYEVTRCKGVHTGENIGLWGYVLFMSLRICLGQDLFGAARPLTPRSSMHVLTMSIRLFVHTISNDIFCFKITRKFRKNISLHIVKSHVCSNNKKGLISSFTR